MTRAAVAIFLFFLASFWNKVQSFVQTTNRLQKNPIVPTSLASTSGRTPILPERPARTVERKKDFTANGSKRSNRARTRKEAEKSPQRELPQNIPRLSSLLRNSQDPTSAESYNSTKSSTDEVDPTKPSGPANSTEPWRASIKTSIRTQGRIKKEFTTNHHGESPNQKAKRILRAFLSTPPTSCNAANLVGALTFSAKALGVKRIEPDAELQTMLFESFEILHTMVQQRLLSTRQLCNACWAIAKHYDRNNKLLPSPPEATALSTDDVVGTAENWNMVGQSSVLQHKQELVDKTVDEIASQLTLILRGSDSQVADGHQVSQMPAKIGEICMASWAYGKLRPRGTPPGWQIPPQLGRIPLARSTAEKMAHTSNLITFEQWGTFGPTKNDDDMVEIVPSAETTGALFDAIASSLCRSPATMGAHGYNQDDAEKLPNCLQDCSWSELANVGWSFASHGRCKSAESQMLLINLSREARDRLTRGGSAMEDFLVRDIAQLLWALGTLQADNFRLADDLVTLVEALSDYLRLGERAPTFGRGRPLLRWSCADLVQVALSLAHARIDNLPLLRTVYEEGHYRLLEGIHHDMNESDGRQRFRPWEVSVLLWGQARLYLKEEQGPIFEEFAADAPKFFLPAISKHGTLADIGIGPQEQANIVWSLTVLEQYKSKEAVKVIDAILREASDNCYDQQIIQLEHAHQLWQAYFLLQEDFPEAVENVPSWFAEYLRDKWNLEKSRVKLSSARHKALSQTLTLMGVQHFNEHDEDIDVAIVLRGDAAWTHETEAADDAAVLGETNEKVSVAVEFDGPNHFTRGKVGAEKSEQPRALGHTVLKYRLLKRQGWSVVRVPYFEFDKIPFWASMERQRYLQRKLKTHANIQFSEVDVSEYKALSPNRKSRFD